MTGEFPGDSGRAVLGQVVTVGQRSILGPRASVNQRHAELALQTPAVVVPDADRFGRHHGAESIRFGQGQKRDIDAEVAATREEGAKGAVGDRGDREALE